MHPGYCTQHRNESKSKEKDEKARDKKNDVKAESKE